jgi:hypothetical protein
MDEWPRWIFASIAKYFKDVAKDTNLVVLIEHLDERVEELMAASDTMEVRITGPYIKQLASGEYNVQVAVNILFTSRYDGVAKNAYKVLDNVGIIVAAMKGPISVYNSINTFLGCLTIPQRQSIMADNYGQIDTSDRVKATEVEVKYQMILTDD